MTMRFSRAARVLTLAGSALSLFASWASPPPAAAFCGFYVTGADSSLYANATMVVLMRDGTRTVLSMQNNYQGPPSEFALVIPVPSVLQKEQVKVLPKDVFTKVDTLSAPRLVEYWEQDPCRPNWPSPLSGAASARAGTGAPSAADASTVRIEAQFEVGEYDVVILSADDSSALDTWLRENQYNIPEGAEPVLAPYVAAGMKFFVAKVDPVRVTFVGDQAALSPLRFHYDTPDFSLPVRLGLLNSQGSQDLIVNILAPQRYELANYKNVTIPTNIRVQDEVRKDFASFYEALFARTLEKNPAAVVTEYSWSASSCDPCPTPPLEPEHLLTLGADVLSAVAAPSNGSPSMGGAPIAPPSGAVATSFTLTRLHARYTKDSLGEDLVFQPAKGLSGGQGIPDPQGKLQQDVQTNDGDWNSFQGRYVILHPWSQNFTCENPQRGSWGGPTDGGSSAPQAPANGALTGAAPVAGDLPALLAESIPSLSVTATTPLDPLKPATPPSPTGRATASGTAGQRAAPGQAVGAGTSTRAPATGTAQNAQSTPAARSGNSVCTVQHGRPDGSLAPLALLAGLGFVGARRRMRSALAERRAR